MNTALTPSRLAVLFALAALLFLQPGKAQAHPQLVGRWFATTPPNVNMSYEFLPGKYLGDGTWQGNFVLYWGNQCIAHGEYELRMNRGTEATVSLRDGMLACVTCATVDLGTRIMTLRGVTYRP